MAIGIVHTGDRTRLGARISSPSESSFFLPTTPASSLRTQKDMGLYMGRATATIVTRAKTKSAREIDSKPYPKRRLEMSRRHGESRISWLKS